MQQQKYLSLALMRNMCFSSFGPLKQVIYFNNVMYFQCSWLFQTEQIELEALDSFPPVPPPPPPPPGLSSAEAPHGDDDAGHPGGDEAEAHGDEDEGHPEPEEEDHPEEAHLSEPNAAVHGYGIIHPWRVAAPPMSTSLDEAIHRAQLRVPADPVVCLSLN